MVVIAKHEYYDAYRQLQQLSFRASVLVFASTRDADAVCAVKILTSLLKLDSVPFSVVPVTDFEHLQAQAKAHLEAAEGDEPEPRAIVMIGCGATESTSDLLPPLAPESRVIVIDTHRPYHLDNVSRRNNQVLVLHDGTNEGFPVEAPVGGWGNADDDSEEEEELDGEDGEERPGGRRRLSADGTYAPRVSASQARRRAEQEHKEEVASYYQRGLYHGRAVAHTLYDLAHSLQRESADLLWYAIVGLTDQYVHQRVADETYEEAQQQLETCLEHPSSTVTLDNGMDVPIAADSHIRSKEEFCFFHLRHWNLADAMMHAPYVAATLKTWEETGERKLAKLFARMGVPLAACKQKYVHMSHDLVRQLEAKLEEFGREVGLHKLRFTSFYTERGHKLQLSASDVALGVSALLEAPTSLDNDLTDNWRKATAALAPTRWPDLRAGIQLSIMQQRTLLSQAGMALARGMSQGGPKLFRCVDVGDSASAMEASVLQNPLALQRLALFLFEETNAGKKRRRPMVVCAPVGLAADAAEDEARYVRIVGVTGRPQLTDTTYNHLQLSFLRAADACKALYRYPTFDPCVIDVRADMLTDFMDNLREVEWERYQANLRG